MVTQDARYNLGCEEWDGIKNYENELSNTKNAERAAVDAIKSPQREEAEEVCIRKLKEFGWNRTGSRPS